MIRVIGKASQDFRHNPDAVKMVTEHFGIRPEDAAAWLAHTQWAAGETLSDDILQHVMRTLTDLKVISQAREVGEVYRPL
jgi:truncated hemoglobin YjbI